MGHEIIQNMKNIICTALRSDHKTWWCEREYVISHTYVERLMQNPLKPTG